MKYTERLEDERFIYELNVAESVRNHPHLYTYTQGEGFYCSWNIVAKENAYIDELVVTDDQCEVIVFDSLESAVRGAKEFLSL